MHTQRSESAGLGESAKQVAEHASALARLELELAALELKRKITALAVGIVLALGAVVLLLYALGFAFAGIANALPVPDWAGNLIVAGGLLLVVGALLVLALGRFKKGTPPVPKQAIEEARLTGEAIKANGRS